MLRFVAVRRLTFCILHGCRLSMAIVSIQMVELIDTIMSIPSCLQDQQSKIQVSPSLPALTTSSPRYRSVHPFLPAGSTVQDTCQSIPSCLQDYQSKIQVSPSLSACRVNSPRYRSVQDQQSKKKVSPSLPACRTNSLRYRSVNSFLPPVPD
jgi:hypothetical protein